MTVAIRQEINILNTPFVSTGTTINSSEFVKCDLTKYNGSTAYFEIIAKNIHETYDGAPSLQRDDDPTFPSQSLAISITVWSGTTEYTRLRSQSFVLSSTNIYYRIQLSSLIGAGEITIKSAKIIILQSAAAITATQTQIEVGAYGLRIPAAVDTWYPIEEPKYWKYESAKWDPTPTFHLAFTAQCEDDKESYHVALEYDDGNFNWSGTYVAEVADLNSEAVTYYESSSFTPTNGYHYRLCYQGDDNKDDFTIFNAKIVATQTDATAITKLQPEYLLINDAQTDTGLQEFQTYFNPAEWDGVSNTYYHEHSANSASSNSKLQTDLDTTPADIANSNITGDGLVRNYGLHDSNLTYDTFNLLYSGSTIAVSQSFQSGFGGILRKAVFKLSKYGSPTGNIYAKLYAHSGTFGTSSIPTGSALATSAAILASTVQALSADFEFIFETPYNLSASTNYCIVLEYNDGNSSNRIQSYFNSTNIHNGNYASYISSWAADSAKDMYFKIYTEGYGITMPSTAKEIDTNIVTA